MSFERDNRLKPTGSIKEARDKLKQVNAELQEYSHRDETGVWDFEVGSLEKEKKKLESYIRTEAKNHLGTAKVDNANYRHNSIFERLVKSNKIQTKEFSKFNAVQSKEVIQHLSHLKKTDEAAYYELVLSIAEVNHIYRDKELNKHTKNYHFEKVVTHLDKKMISDIAGMSMDLKNKTIYQSIHQYKHENNPDKKKLILDHINSTYTSKDDLKIINKSISQMEIDNMLDYKSTPEYKIYKGLPILDGHTAEDIFKQSPQETRKQALKLSETSGASFLKKVLIPVWILAFIFAGPWKWFKGFLLRLLWIWALGATYASAKEMNPEADWLKNPLKAFLDKWQSTELPGTTSTQEWRKNDKVKTVNTAINNLNNTLQKNKKLWEWKVDNIFGQLFVHEKFKKTSVEDLNNFANNGTKTAQDIFDVNMPINEKGKEYSNSDLQKMIKLLLIRRDPKDRNGHDLLTKSTNIKPTPGTNSKKQDRKTTPGAAGVATWLGVAPGTSDANKLLKATPGTTRTKTASLGSTPGTKDILEVVPKSNRFEQIGFTNQEWEQFIIGPDGNPELMSYAMLSPEYKEALKDYSHLSVKINNLLLITQAAAKYNAKYLPIQQQLWEKLSQIQLINIEESIEQLKGNISNISAQMNLGDLNISNNIDVYNYIRDEFNGWQIVKKEILLNTFTNEKETSFGGITSDDLEKFINGDLNIPTGIQSILWEDADEIQQETIIKKSKAKQEVLKNRSEILKQIGPNHPNPNEAIKNIEHIYESVFAGDYIETELIKAHIKKNGTGGNEQLALFKDIEWIGWNDVADSTYDLVKNEWPSILLTEAIALGVWFLTAGAWYAAIKGWVYAIRAGRYAGTWSKLVKSIDSMASSNKLTKFARNTAIEWTTFHWGYVYARNNFLGEEMSYLEWWGQSVFMAGAMRWVQGIFKWTKSNTLRLTKEVAAGTGVLSGIGFYNDGVLFEPGEWSPETVYQALIMYAGLRAAGWAVWKLKFSQTPNGGVSASVQKPNLKPNSTQTAKTKSGKEYEIQVDKLWNAKVTSKESGKQMHGAVKNNILQRFNINEVVPSTWAKISNTIKAKITDPKTIGEKVNKLKDGQRLDGLWEYAIIRKWSEYRVVKWSDITIFKSPAKAAEHVNIKMWTTRNLKAILSRNIRSQQDDILKHVSGKEINVWKNTYQISKQWNEWKLLKQWVDKGFKNVTNWSKFSNTEAAKIMEHIAGKGAIWKIEAGTQKIAKTSFSERFKIPKLKEALINKWLTPKDATRVTTNVGKSSLNTLKHSQWIERIATGWKNGKWLNKLSWVMKALFNRNAAIVAVGLTGWDIYMNGFDENSESDLWTSYAIASFMNPYLAVAYNYEIVGELLQLWWDTALNSEIVQEYLAKAKDIDVPFI